MEKKYYLAIDIGASSGRHIVGWAEDGIQTEEVYRFPNFVDRVGKNLYWDTERLFGEIVEGIRIALQKFPKIESLAIDTWGVDYVLLDEKGNEILPCHAYRDGRTEDVVEKVHTLMPPEELYKRTGIQFQPFNTIYQLFCDKLSGKLQKASAFLMMPEYFSYKLTGVRKKEYTNASTTGLLDAEKKVFDESIVNALGFPKSLFSDLCQAGEKVGDLTEEIQKKVGGNIPVVFCPSHDTASAFEAISVADDVAILSSGTWSLFGAKLEKAVCSPEGKRSNFTNEGGVGYIRFLKNIMGLWIIGELRKEFDTDYATMVDEGRISGYEEIFDVNDASLLAPEKMSEAVLKLLGKESLTRGELFSSVYHSLAYSYKVALEELERVTKKRFSSVCIVGGGAKNRYLNELTERYTQRKVIALPIEATAIGNIKSQIKG